MKNFKRANVTELELEDLVRRHPEQIEAGLVFLDHQKHAAGGRLDVLMVDSGKQLVVAELKITQDDGMLLQGLDYYDYVSTHAESFARLYKVHPIDPTQPVRLFLIAPSFSQALINRCKWFNFKISLFTFQCLKFQDESDVVPIFSEQQITTLPEVVEVTHLEDHLNYVTDLVVRGKVTALLEEIKNWKHGSISIDAIKVGLSLKVNGHVFAYVFLRRGYYLVATYDESGDWTEYAVKTDDDLAKVKSLAKAAMEARIN